MMDSKLVTALAGTNSMPDSTESIHLRGRWLMAGRATWAAILILVLFVMGQGVYILVSLGNLPCSPAYGGDWPGCRTFEQALHQLGLSNGFYHTYEMLLWLIAALPYFVVSFLIIRRRPNGLMPLLFAVWLLVMGAAGSWFGPTWQWIDYPSVNPFIGWLGQWIAITLPNRVLPLVHVLGTLAVCYTFPTGEFVPRWTRWLTFFWIPVVLGGSWFPGTPLDTGTLPGPFPQVIILSLVASTAYVLLYRYRHTADRIQRQQIKWFAVGLCMPLLNFIVDYSTFVVYPYLTGHYPLAPGMAEVIWELVQDSHWYVSSFIFAICIGIAIFRYKLWNIDLIINRALVYGTLTALIIAVYVLIVVSLGALFQSGGNLFIGLIATGIVAVFFQPLHRRLQRAVNRLMFGKRDEPFTVLTDLSKRLESPLALETALPATVETVAIALKLPYAAIEVQEGETSRISAEYGAAVGKLVRLPLIDQSQVIGHLIVAPRSQGETLNSADQRVLENVAHLTSAAFHDARLTADLQESRLRLVTAQEEERRRLRRDLHDGLGPALASLSLQAETARDLIHTDPQKSETLLNEVVAGTQAAIADIRRVVYALRPPALDDLGLLSALKEQAVQYTQNDLHITLDAPEVLPPLPAAVEVAVYRIVLEALTNVVRHAQAHTCVVHLWVNRSLEVEIADDGQGIVEAHRAGVGLNSMRERTAELGGLCEISSTPGKGTYIHVTLPYQIG
jgi:signal transduction histidine kinase